MTRVIPLLTLLVILTPWPLRAELITDDAVKRLTWVESASPDEYFQRDSVGGKYKFYMGYGYAYHFPGVGQASFSKCYSGVVETVDMTGPSDVVRSAREKELRDIAWKFALAYNVKMKEFIDSTGLSKCKPNVDWDAALNKLNDYVRGNKKFGTAEGVGFDFWSSDVAKLLVTIENPERADGVLKKSCSLLVENGITESVTVSLYQWLQPPPPGHHTKPIGEFKCANGTVQ